MAEKYIKGRKERRMIDEIRYLADRHIGKAKSLIDRKIERERER